MDALIKVRPEELKQELLDKIISFIGNADTTEIIIQIKESSPAFILEEEPADYMRQLKTSIKEKENGNTTVFSMEEFRQYVTDNFSQ